MNASVNVELMEMCQSLADELLTFIVAGEEAGCGDGLTKSRQLYERWEAFQETAGTRLPIKSESQTDQFEHLDSVSERAAFLLEVGVSARREETAPGYCAFAGDLKLPITAATESLAIGKGVRWLKEMGNTKDKNLKFTTETGV
ncbi:MAG TPA: hypothetical protein ENJ17_01180 [Gammaproteobacteria bacterium]|nr:hypothetical protein [Gammaproteobacteria bacterium]